jgi:hypothetical protein
MKLHRNNLVMDLHSYNILPTNLCDYLINLYESDKDNRERVDNESKPTFTQLNLNRYHQKIVSNLFNYFSLALDSYKKDVSSSKYLPEIKYIEEFRIKKYEIGGVDRFDEHVDVIDHKSAKRCLAMLFYLNDVDEGGKTIFPHHHKEFTPVKGSVIIFPPTWEYPHLGEPPVSNPKYIMSSYLHYY